MSLGLTTNAHGKYTQDLHTVVKEPPTHIAVKMLEEVWDTVYVKVRSDIDDMLPETQRMLATKLDELADKGQVTVSVKKWLDPVSRRMRHKTVVIPGDRPFGVTPAVASKLLNARRLGMLFEECSPDGTPYKPAPKARPTVVPVDAPPKPSAQALAEKDAEIEKLRAQLAAMAAEPVEDAAPKIAPPKPKASKKGSKKS